MGKLKVGLIGCGKIAQCHHATELLKLGKKAAITALFDLKAENAEKLKRDNSLDATIHGSVEALLASDVDAVVISTPNSSHCELTLQALAAGKHVLVEKPMAAKLADADRMIAAAQKAGLHLQVNQTIRYLPVYAKIKELVERGAIGAPLHIRCVRAGTASPDKGWSLGAKWFVSKAFAGGVVMDIAVHMADMMAWYFGEVESVYASTGIKGKDCEVTDNVSALFDFKNGATGVLELSWTFPVGSGLLEIYGETGAIRLGFDAKGALELSSGGKPYKAVKIGKVKGSHERFVEGVNGKPGAPCPVEIGRGALSLCAAIQESGDKRQAVKPK